MQRLLCIVSSMNAGGAETFLMKLYRMLDKDKYQMDFCINVKEKCFYEKEICQMGGRIYRIPSKSENLIEFRKQLSNIITEYKYTHVLRITSSAMGFMDLKIAKKAGAKVCAARSSNSSDGGSIRAGLVHIMGRLLYNRYVDVKIAPSDVAAKYTFGKKAYNRGEVNMLHNAIEIDAFQYSMESRNLIRKEFGISNNTKVIGHIGRFSLQKNHDFLIDVFKEIKKIDPNTVLLLIGKGELEEEIRNKVKSLAIEKSVIFAGVRSDISAILSAMDVFMFPSFYEGMPNTVIEAQANGLQCVIADTITKEADITGLIEYLPLSLSPEGWAKKVVTANEKRQDQTGSFILHRYDITSVVQDFTNFVFKE